MELLTATLAQMWPPVFAAWLIALVAWLLVGRHYPEPLRSWFGRFTWVPPLFMLAGWPLVWWVMQGREADLHRNLVGYRESLAQLLAPTIPNVGQVDDDLAWREAVARLRQIALLPADHDHTALWIYREGRWRLGWVDGYPVEQTTLLQWASALDRAAVMVLAEGNTLDGTHFTDGPYHGFAYVQRVAPAGPAAVPVALGLTVDEPTLMGQLLPTQIYPMLWWSIVVLLGCVFMASQRLGRERRRQLETAAEIYRRRDRWLQAVAEATARLAGASPVKEVLPQVLALVGKGAGADAAAVYELDAQGIGQCLHQWPPTGGSLPTRLQLSPALLARLDQRQPTVWTEGEEQCLMATVFLDHGPWAFLKLRLGAPLAWSDGELSALRTLAESLGQAHQRQLLVKAVQLRDDQRRVFVENLPAAVAMLDHQMRYLVTSRRWLEDYRLPLSVSLEGRSHYEVFPEIPEHWKRIHQRALAGEALQNDEDYFRRADGREQWLRWVVRPWHADDGQVGGVLMLTQDLTERKIAERDLARQNSRLATLLSNLQDGILVEDEDRRIALTNARFCEIFGIPVAPELLRGYDCRESARQSAPVAADPALFLETVERLIAQRQVALRRELRLADGRTLEYDYIPIFADGQFQGNLWHYRDITAERRAAAELSAAVAAAKAATQAKSDFLANMSHEIRTPLNGVLGMTTVLEKTELNSFQRDCVQTIRVSGDGLLTLLNDLLDFTKIEAGKLEIDTHEFSPQAIVEEVLDLLAGTAASRQLCLGFHPLGPVPAIVRGDSTRFRQILVNLVGNAVKFTERGEAMVLLEGLGEHGLRVRVVDTGIGIATERLGRLFQPFSQGDGSTTRRFGGTGLGLAICRRLVDLLGGCITVESAVGEGTTFTVELPFPAVAAATPPSEAPAWCTPPRVLVVEPLVGHRQALVAQLTRVGAMVSAVATEGEAQALLLAGQSPRPILLWRQALRQSASATLRDYQPSIVVALLGPSLGVSANDPSAPTLLFQPVKLAALERALGEAILGALPPGASRAPSAAAGRPRPTTAPAVAAEATLREGLEVLVVDDSAVNRKVAALYLKRLGCLPEVAENGRIAVTMATAKSYAIILMDVQMPEMDGFEATRAIRELHQTPSPVIVGLTAYAMAGDREKCLAAGMDEYLPKPLQFEALDQLFRRRGWTVPPA